MTHQYYLDTCFLSGAKAPALEMDLSDGWMAFKCNLCHCPYATLRADDIEGSDIEPTTLRADDFEGRRL